MSGLPAAPDVAPRIRSLPHRVRSRIAELILGKQLDLASTSDVRTQLGLGTPDAAVLSAEFRQLTDRFGADMARGVVVGVCSDQTASIRPQLVWTAPGAPAAARRTAQVINDLVGKAKEDLLVVGYSLTKAAGPFIAAVAEAAARGVTCTVVADRMEEKLATLAELWPSQIGLPRLWTRPPNAADEKSALHAKFVVVDRHRLLLTSANLTYHGFHGNMEVGVLLEGSVAAEAEQLVREWSKAGLIRRVGAPAP